MSTYRLKYIFRAYYKDKPMYVQNEADTSQTTLGRTAWYDVVNTEPIAFSLEGAGQMVVLDLEGGRFLINGVAVVDPECRAQRVVTPKRLIYFRRVQQTLGGPSKEPEAYTKVAYHIGWQANDEDGNNIKYVMELV
jgi:hypothetical protein